MSSQTKGKQTLSSKLKSKKTAATMPQKLESELKPQLFNELKNMQKAKVTPTKKNNIKTEDGTSQRKSTKKSGLKVAAQQQVDDMGVVEAKKARCTSSSINSKNDLKEEYLDNETASTSLKAVGNKATTSEILVKIEDEYEEPKLQEWEPNNWNQVLDNIRTMRSSDSAPVDTMGCHKCADESADEKMSTNDSIASVADEASLHRDDIKENLISGAYKLTPKNGRSKVWEVFGNIEDNEGAEITDRVGCRTCFAVYKVNPKTTSNLVRHKCYIKMMRELKPKTIMIDVDFDIKKETLQLFSQWSIENCRPLQLSQDCCLKRIAELMALVGAKYGTNVDIDRIFPQATAISKSIDQLFDVTLANVKNDIQENCHNGYGLTSDLWTDSNLQQNFTCLTIHFIKQGQLVTKLLGLCAMDDDRSSRVSVNIQIQRWLSDYNCKLEDAIMVTGRDTNMMTAFNQFTHNYCINHLLSNVVNKSIEQIEEITELFNSCSKLLQHLKTSATNFNFDTIPQIQCATRWHRVYYLLEAVDKNWPEIEIILEQNKQLQRIENINLHYIKGLLQVLQPFEQTSAKLEVESHATLHLVYPYISGLKDTCVVHNDDVDVIKRLKESLSERLQSEVMDNMTVTHKIALFLFPPANKLPHFSVDERSLVKSECVRQLKLYCYNEAAAESASVQSTVPQKNPTILSSYFTNFISPAKNVNTNDKISEEIQAYEMLNIPFQDNFDIINWWHLRQGQFPLLYKLSCKILATPASKASSDRVFAAAKQLLYEKDSSLPYKTQRFHKLVALMLSSQTKDEITYNAMLRLREQTLTPESICEMKVNVLENILHPVSFYKNKAKYLQKTAKILIDNFNSDIPNTIKELVALPGVGPKMTHICMSTAWHQTTGIGVDVHVHRISNRLQWVPKPTKEPEQTRVALESWLPRELWKEVNHLLVGFGQTICTPLKPKCVDCLNCSICPSAPKSLKSKEKFENKEIMKLCDKSKFKKSKMHL